MNILSRLQWQIYVAGGGGEGGGIRTPRKNVTVSGNFEHNKILVSNCSPHYKEYESN